MKRFVSFILAMMLMCGAAMAEGIDWAGLTDEEIYAEINNARAELVKRELAGNTENVTVFEENNVTIVCKSFSVDSSDWMYKPALVIAYTIVNESGDDYEIFIDNVAVNGWEVDSMGYAEAAAGHKNKDSFKLNLEDAEVSSIDEIESIEISFNYQIPNKFEYVHTEPITITF